MADPSVPSVTDDPDAVNTASTSNRDSAEPAPPASAVEPGSVPVDDTGTVAPERADTVRIERAEPEAGGTSGAGDLADPPPVLSPDDHAAVDHRAVDPDGDAGDELDDEDDEDDEDEDDELDDDADDDSGGKRGGLLTRQVQVDARMILAIVAVLALFAGAYVLGQRQGKTGAQEASKPTTASTAAVAVPKDFAKFDDKETGVSLSYPKDWTQFSTKDLDASYRLLVGVPNAKDNLRVRVNAYSKDVTKENVGDQKAVIDAIFTDEKVNIVSANAVELNGLPALFYVYKFTDSTGAPGYHAHFFVFQGRKMVSLVFEAVPEARYAQLAEVFDKIAGSVQIAPGPPPAFLEPITGTSVPGAPTPPASAPPASAPATTAKP